MGGRDVTGGKRVGGEGEKKGDVEHVVEREIGRKVQAVSHWVDAFKDAKGPYVFMVKFLRGTDGAKVKSGEPNKVADGEGVGGAVGVGVTLIGEAGRTEMPLKLRKEEGKRVRKDGGGWGGERGEGVGAGLKAVVCKEGRGVGGGVERLIVREFGEGKEGNPIVLVKGRETTEVLFERLIDSFSLSVGLRMKRGGEMDRNAEFRAKEFPKTRDELRAAVRNNGGRETVETKDGSEEEAREIGSRDAGGAGDEVCHFRERANPNRNSREPVTRGKADNEVGREGFPRAGGNG